jgi:hypothetical protein
LIHLFHKYISVVDIDHSICGNCFTMPDRMSEKLAAEYPQGYCPHSFKVCKCGKWKGWGSHGRLSVIPDNCKRQIDRMIRGYDNEV